MFTETQGGSDAVAARRRHDTVREKVRASAAG